MSGRPVDLVPLGEIHDLPRDARDYGPTWPTIFNVVECFFQAAQIAVNGRNPKTGKRELIEFPQDYGLNWVADASLKPGLYCEVFAHSLKYWNEPGNAKLADRYEDLAMERGEWERLLQKLSLLGLVERPRAAGEAARKGQNRQAYAQRVADFRLEGKEPPRETTKAGIIGDLQWARGQGVSRPDVKLWRQEEGVIAKRGAPRGGRKRGRAAEIRQENSTNE